MHNNLIKYCVLLIISTTFSYSIPNLDSLEKILYKSATDTAKLYALADLAWYYKNITPTKAISFAKKGLELANKMKYLAFQTEFHATLGANYLVLNDEEKAIEHYNIAVNNALLLEDTISAASYYNNLGVANRKVSRYDEALNYYKHSAALYSKSNLSDKLSSSLINIASIYSDMGRDDIAMENYAKALKMKKNLNDTSGMTTVLNNMALIEQNKGNYQKARNYLESTLIYSRKLGDSNGVVVALINIGLNYHLQKKNNEAIRYYDLSLPLVQTVEDVNIKIDLHNYYGSAYIELNQIDKAIEHINQSLELSESYKDFLQMSESYSLLNRAYVKQGNYEKAHFYLNLVLSLKDSINDKRFSETLALETAEAIIDMKAKLELDKKNKEIDVLENQRIVSKEYIRYLWLLLGLIIVAFFGFFILYKMIRKNNKTLSQAFMDLKLKDEMLNETISIKDKFFHIIAHDLRNPLGVFLNISDYISNNYKEMTEDELQQFLYDLKRSSKHLNVLLDNLILWSNLQTGKVNMTPEHFLISVLCTQLERDWLETSKTKNLTILSEYSDSKKITADMNMTIFIFKNLVSNAIKYSNDNQTINIRTYELGENVVFEVKDNGVGIDSTRAEKLFHYDKSLKTKGTQMESGTGLGLILVKQLLELNNGRLEFDTKPNEGSTFRAFFS